MYILANCIQCLLKKPNTKQCYSLINEGPTDGCSHGSSVHTRTSDSPLDSFMRHNQNCFLVKYFGFYREEKALISLVTTCVKGGGFGVSPNPSVQQWRPTSHKDTGKNKLSGDLITFTNTFGLLLCQIFRERFQYFYLNLWHSALYLQVDTFCFCLFRITFCSNLHENKWNKWLK